MIDRFVTHNLGDLERQIYETLVRMAQVRDAITDLKDYSVTSLASGDDRIGARLYLWTAIKMQEFRCKKSAQQMAEDDLASISKKLRELCGLMSESKGE